MRMQRVEIAQADVERVQAVIERHGHRVEHFRITGRLAPNWLRQSACGRHTHVEVGVTYPGIGRVIYGGLGNWVADFERDLVARRFGSLMRAIRGPAVANAVLAGAA